jgi:uncharacterized protein YehS (DUF1456 family)
LTNNYILRRLRYTFEYNDRQMIALWASAECAVTREHISQWLKKDDDPDFVNCPDKKFASFLNGMINKLRGKKDGPQALPESRLNNNIILRKLKIALNLRDDDICELMALGGYRVSKSELSAFFRKVGHKHYRELQDQMLRKFIQGMQRKYRDSTDADETAVPASPVHSKEDSNSESDRNVNSAIWNKSKAGK